MLKNPISFSFIIASPLCSIKPLPKDMTSIFKFFYEKWKDIIQKEKMVKNQDLLDYSE